MLAPCRQSLVRHWRGASSFHTTGAMAKRTYTDAVTALNSLQSNFAVLDAIRASGRKMNEKAIPEMIEWCRRAGFAPTDLNRLNAIHIAGTKGKGSTSAFISSILQQYTRSQSTDSNAKGFSPTTLAPTKLGLYTSPHLRFVRERIQLDGAPIGEQDFADAFFSVWDRLEKAAEDDPRPDGTPSKPVYFRFLTLMAFHAYLAKGVDTAIIECGIGGEYDSTNVLVQPSITGITSLGIDHTNVLGPTIEGIAWHKSGIMKPGVPLFTAPQPESALEVLRKRASEKGVDLKVVDLHPEIASGKAKLGLSGDFQKGNASLAVEIAAAHLRRMGHKGIDTRTLNDKFLRGLQEVQWGGRCETREDKTRGITWHMDGAHTIESIDAASQWFGQCVRDGDAQARRAGKSTINVLLFNQQQRSGGPLLQKLHEVVTAMARRSGVFDQAIFCTNVTFDESGYRPDLMDNNASEKTVSKLDVQNGLAEAWRSIDSRSHVAVLPTIESAVKSVRALAETSGAGPDKAAIKVFAVGSIHLIGGVLEVLDSMNS